MREIQILSQITKDDLKSKGFKVNKLNKDDYATTVEYNDFKAFIVIDDFNVCQSILYVNDYIDIIKAIYDNFPNVKMVEEDDFFTLCELQHHFEITLSKLEDEYCTIFRHKYNIKAEHVEFQAPPIDANTNLSENRLLDTQAALFS